ncbi:hypothetical protein [Tumebacillus avium]|nr:hypothetical protein [Tumebacillus avium]
MKKLLVVGSLFSFLVLGTISTIAVTAPESVYVAENLPINPFSIALT